MSVRAETQITLTRVDDGSPGSTGPQGPQGWGIVATVERNAFTESQWTTYGTIGHVEGWSGTSSIRNGCRIGDLFLVKGTATDTGRSHELTYRSDTSSGDLHGECINHTYAERGAQGIQGPTGPTGPAGPGITYVTLQNGDDMNSCIAKDTIYVTSQTAVCNSLLNMPTGFPAGELRLEIEWMGSNDYLVQHLYCKNGAIRKTYLRTYSNGTFGAWTEEGVVYGTSSTAASTAAKTATVDNYELDSKQYFAIKFTNENTASNPTLSVNGGTTKAIYTNGVNAAYWEAGATVNFYYDGTYYQVASAPVYASTVTVGNPNGDNVFIGNSAVQVKQGSSVKAEFKATEASLGGNKAKVKYTEDAGVLGLASHRIVVCKSSNDAGTRNDAVLTSLDLANFDLNSTPMAFIDGGHMVSGANKGADAGLYVFDGNGDINYIYVGIGGQGGTTALGNSVGIKSSNNVDIDADNNINIVGNNVKIIGDNFWATDDGDVYVDRWLTVGQDIVTPSIDVDGATLTDFVTGKGKSGSWYYQFWKSGKIEAWGSNITTSTATVTRVSSMLYRAYNVSVSIPSDIFDSTPTMAMVSPNYGSTSNVQLVSAMASCSSATSLRVQLWKNGNSSDGVALNFYVVYFPSTY